MRALTRVRSHMLAHPHLYVMATHVGNAGFKLTAAAIKQDDRVARLKS